MDMEQYSHEPHVMFSQGKGNLLKANLQLTSGASAEIYLQGAHVTSFKDEEGQELLFVSSKSNFEQQKAIRGGIPVIFPQFGPGELPQHGFARTASWAVKDALVKNAGNEVSLVLECASNASTKAIWPHEFVFSLTTTLALPPGERARLTQNMKVTNTDQHPFNFTIALHTYFSVPAVQNVQVFGLHNLSYLDKLQNTTCMQQEVHARIQGPTDRIYYNAPDQVVWNCHEEGAKKMTDMADHEWSSYICVEVAAIGKPIELGAQSCWEGTQTLTRSSGDSKY